MFHWFYQRRSYIMYILKISSRDWSQDLIHAKQILYPELYSYNLFYWDARDIHNKCILKVDSEKHICSSFLLPPIAVLCGIPWYKAVMIHLLYNCRLEWSYVLTWADWMAVLWIHPALETPRKCILSLVLAGVMVKWHMSSVPKWDIIKRSERSVTYFHHLKKKVQV